MIRYCYVVITSRASRVCCNCGRVCAIPFSAHARVKELPTTTVVLLMPHLFFGFVFVQLLFLFGRSQLIFLRMELGFMCVFHVLAAV